MTPILAWFALALVVADPVTVRVVMPGSGVAIEGLPADTQWEVAGTVVIGARDARPVDRLLGSDERGGRRVTLEIRRSPCGPAPRPGTSAPWPTLGYAATREPRPERRAVRSCKLPDLDIELRFPAGVASDPGALLEEADRWEPVLRALHEAYGATHIDLAAALGERAKLAFERGDDAPDDLLARLAAPLRLRDGLTFERAADGLPWLVRDLLGHDVLTLPAPTGAGLGFELLPFPGRYSCESAMTAALRSYPEAPAGTPPVALPQGFQMARAIGSEGAAFCARGAARGYVAIGGARLPRQVWMPIALPILGRLGERLASTP